MTPYRSSMKFHMRRSDRYVGVKRSATFLVTLGPDNSPQHYGSYPTGGAASGQAGKPPNGPTRNDSSPQMRYIFLRKGMLRRDRLFQLLLANSRLNPHPWNTKIEPGKCVRIVLKLTATTTMLIPSITIFNICQF